MSATGTNTKYTFLTTSHKITINLHGGSRQILAGPGCMCAGRASIKPSRSGCCGAGDGKPVMVQCRLALQFPPSSSGEASMVTLGDQPKPQKAHGLEIQTTPRNKGQNLGLRTSLKHTQPSKASNQTRHYHTIC